MSDLISRQDAIDAFGLSEKTRKYGGDHSGYNTMMLYEIQDILEGLPSAEPKTGGWIPCSERLPKDKEPVLVTVKWFDGVTRMQRDAHFKGGWLSDCDDSQVIAWMPLPEPYKEDTDE